jgi:protein-L-isoaspartate(D-aspartate) O-methyltransferase
MKIRQRFQSYPSGLRWLVIILTAAFLISLAVIGGNLYIQNTSKQAKKTQETEADPYDIPRQNMVNDQIEARGIDDPLVLMAMRKVPRHIFVLPEYLSMAYDDHPLPIDYGQTISQPYIVALMSSALGLTPGDKVLEIGTGSGYQAAVLAEMGMQVYSIEIIPELVDQARKKLDDAGYTQVVNSQGDGYYGWDEFAPYDAIMVTAAPDHLPPLLSNQLREGGRLVIPIGPLGSLQTLWLFVKENGQLNATNLGGVSFVPLTGEH